MTRQEFEKMTDYFRQKYFDNIPKIPYHLVKKTNLGKNADASFVLRQNDDYDIRYDTVINCPEYNKRVDIMEGFGFNYGHESWTDPLNHPSMYIEVKHALLRDPLRLVGVIMHELTHYWCWYCGYEHSDGSIEFERKLKELGLPSNWTHVGYKKEEKKWIDIFDYTTMKKYYDDYLVNAS